MAMRRGEGKYYSNSACTPAIRPSLISRPANETHGEGGGRGGGGGGGLWPLLAPNLELSVCHPFCLEEEGGVRGTMPREGE